MGVLCIIIVVVWFIVSACKDASTTSYLKDAARKNGQDFYNDTYGNPRDIKTDKKIYK